MSNLSTARLAPRDQALAEFPRVEIELSAFQKLTGFLRLMPRHEINGFGIVHCLGNRFRITDVFLVDQVVSVAEVVTDDKAFNRLISDLAAQGGDPSLLRLQWHSHVTMPAFFSGTDIATIRNYTNDFMISLVMNRQGEYSCRIDVFEPFAVTIETPLYVVVPPDPAIEEQCQENIRRHVRTQRVFAGISLGSRAARPKPTPSAPIAIPADHFSSEEESP